MGYIVRTVCEGAATDALQADMEFLERTWNRVQRASKGQKAPSLLHAEYGLVLRAVRDLFDEDVARGWWSTTQGHLRPGAVLCRRLHARRPGPGPPVPRAWSPCSTPMASRPRSRGPWGRKVWLKSGGYLVIDQTEALMAIDVNSARFVGSSSLEDTTLRINLEAVKEVVAQLRLRNIGGLIIIDFIDMDREQNRDKVFRALEEALQR